MPDYDEYAYAWNISTYFANVLDLTVKGEGREEGAGKQGWCCGPVALLVSAVCDKPLY